MCFFMDFVKLRWFVMKMKKIKKNLKINFYGFCKVEVVSCVRVNFEKNLANILSLNTK